MPDIVETVDATANATTAYVLQAGQTAQGRLNSTGDHDWYKVDLVAGHTYTFAMTGTGTDNVRDTIIALYHPSGTAIVASNDDGLPGLNSIFTYTATASGTFYLDAAAYSLSEVNRQYGLSFTEDTRASFDGLMGAGVLDTEASWSAIPGTAAAITYAFRDTYFGVETNFQQLTPAQIAAVERSLGQYSEVAGLTFTRVNPNGYSNDATMLFSSYAAEDGAGAYAYTPGATASAANDGDVWLNRGSVSTTSLNEGGYSHFTILHEIGHAVGLSHPGEYNAGVGIVITYGTHAQFSQDTHQYTVMSYFDEANTTNSFQSYPDTLMLFDVLALQNIYGANTATRAGDTIYGYNTTQAGSVYDFTSNTSPVVCIWDGGGIDTLDLSGWSGNQNISLVAGSFSDVRGLSGNVSVAFGAVIENAFGGAGSDLITGNDAGNSLVGGAGADTLFGGEGGDQLVGGLGFDQLFGGGGDDEVTYDAGDNLAQVKGGTGNDTLVVTAFGVPTAFDLTAHEFERAEQRLADTAGLEAWASQKNVFNAQWGWDQQYIINDNGTNSYTELDELGVEAWSSVVNQNDAANRWDWQLVYYDNGTSNFTELDQLNNEVWTQVSNQNDAGGLWDWQLIYYDNGTSNFTNLDQLGAEAWTKVSNQNNAAGQWDWQLIYYDDGTTDFTELDEIGNQTWTTVTNHNTVSELWDWQLIYNDDGTSQFSDIDQGDENVWASDVYVNGSTGSLLNHYWIMDDGSYLVIL